MPDSGKNRICLHLLQGMATTWLLSISWVGLAGIPTIMAVHIFPAVNYTRVMIESNFILKYRTFTLIKPERLVLDIERLRLNSSFSQINGKVQPKDPCISQVRIGQFGSEIVRLVLELKQKVTPHFLTLSPDQGFRYRLVLNLYPNQSNRAPIQSDPLLELLTLLEDYHNKENLFHSLPLAFWVKPVRKIERDRTVVVMLDPGHGGEDPGAIGKNKTCEKDIALQIACRLSALIKREPTMQVYMTRNEDVFVPLKMRVDKAHNHQADLFISIHADAFTHRNAHGASVFSLSTKGATSTEAFYLAKTQNATDEIGGIRKSGDLYLDHAIFDLIQTATIHNSLKFGNHVLSYVSKITQLHKNSVDQAGFAVLKSPDIPSILVETAFISNIQEEKKLRTAYYQQQIAKAIFSGIKAYFSSVGLPIHS